MLAPQNDTLNKIFNVVHRFSTIIDLKIAEAPEINKTMPFITVKFNVMSTILNLF